MPEAADLLQLAVDVATAAGALILDGQQKDRTSVRTKSSRTDMVTEMDIASESLIAASLRQRRPGDAIVGEEGARQEGHTGVRWIVDPLDGTTNYLYGWPTFSVSIAAEIDDQVAVGVVHDPSHRETFTAIRGAGAWIETASGQGRPAKLSVEHTPRLAEALVATGFNYDARVRAHQAAVLTRVLPAVRDIRRAGAASLDLCWVAAGRLDAFYEAGLQPWDWAAGALVASEAGASVGDLTEGPPSRSMTLAAPIELAECLRALLVEAARDSPLDAQT